MAQIIDGRALAEKIKDNIVQEVEQLCQASLQQSDRPNLAIILIGEREDSKLYVSLKEREAKKVGIDTHLYRCPENISEREVLDMIDFLNKDAAVNAILVQLPLPGNFDTDAIIRAIDPAKDVDGFHPDNIEAIIKSCDSGKLTPPVFGAVLEILNSIKYKLEGKRVCVISKSDIFGRSLAKDLRCHGAEAEAIKDTAKNLIEKSSQADILISAIGRPEFIKAEMVKKGAVIIDIGITKQDNKVVGDVDYEDVKDKADYITPVPGGVGPLTIACAFKNTVELYKQQKNK